MPDTKPIYTILKEGDQFAKLNLLDQLPANTMKDSARGLVASDNPMTTLLGLQLSAQSSSETALFDRHNIFTCLVG